MKKSELRQLIREEIENAVDTLYKPENWPSYEDYLYSRMIKLYGWAGIHTSYEPNIYKSYGKDVVQYAIKNADRVKNYKKELRSQLANITNSEEFKLLLDLTKEAAGYYGNKSRIKAGDVFSALIDYK